MLAASYAKINLFLELTGKLPNNYHQVNTVFSSIDLCDFMHYVPSPQGEIELSCNIPDLAGSANLVYKVASHIKERFRVKQGISIHLEKHIPLAAGLGGGSSNAAHCILALNELWNLKLGKDVLHEIAASFGSDINFFLTGGTALGTGRGEQITPMNSIEIPFILLINPHIPIASSLAYKLVSLPSAAELMHFDPNDLQGTCFNRLEAGIRVAYPAIDKLLYTLKNVFYAKVAMLSGSGSTCFGIFSNRDALQDCKDYFSKAGYWTHASKTIAHY